MWKKHLTSLIYKKQFQSKSIKLTIILEYWKRKKRLKETLKERKYFTRNLCGHVVCPRIQMILGVMCV